MMSVATTPDPPGAWGGGKVEGGMGVGGGGHNQGERMPMNPSSWNVPNLSKKKKKYTQLKLN